MWGKTLPSGEFFWKQYWENINIGKNYWKKCSEMVNIEKKLLKKILRKGKYWKNQKQLLLAHVPVSNPLNNNQWELLNPHEMLQMLLQECTKKLFGEVTRCSTRRNWVGYFIYLKFTRVLLMDISKIR